METNVNYTVVGAFVIVLIAAMVYIIIWLSAGFSGQSYNIYKVYMHEAVTGLNIDSPVEFNGVNVGTVYKIKLNLQNPKLVELLLKVKSNTPVTRGTRAKLELRSLSGLTYMQLLDKGTDLRPIPILPGEKYPVVLTTPSILIRLNTALTQITESFKQINASFQKLFDQENLKSIKETLMNMRNFTDTLSKNRNEIDTMLYNMSNVSQSLKLEVLPAANRAFTNFGNVSENFSGLSGQIKQNPAVIIRGRAPQPLGPGEE